MECTLYLFFIVRKIKTAAQVLYSSDKCRTKILRLAGHFAKIAEFCEFFAEAQIDGASGAVSMLGDNNFGLSFFI